MTNENKQTGASRRSEARKQNKALREFAQKTLLEKREFLMRGIAGRRITIKRLAEEQRQEKKTLAGLNQMIDELGISLRK